MISTRPRNRAFPDRTRSRPVKGSGDNAGKRFRCQVCGFMCRTDREELGTDSGVSHTAYYKAVYLEDEGSPYSDNEIQDENSSPIYFEELDGYKSDISTGCPFCGSKNWKRQ